MIIRYTAKNVYTHIHIDTTFVFLRENTVLINPHRVNWRNLPEFLSRMDIITPEPYPTQVLDKWVLQYLTWNEYLTYKFKTSNGRKKSNFINERIRKK